MAESFADIFFNNCCQNGILPVRLGAEEMAELFSRAERSPGPYRLTIDLQHCRVADEAEYAASFRMDDYRREMLLQGLDEIGRTLRQEPAIAAYEARRARRLAGVEQ